MISREGNTGLQITQRDIFVAKTVGPELVQEASIGRAYQHFLNSAKKSFALISYERPVPDERTKEENEAKGEEMKKWIRSLGLGYVPLVGHWEGVGADGKKYSGYEDSFFVVGISLADAKSVMGSGSYNQEGVLYSGPETGGRPTLFRSDGSKEVLEKFHPRRIGNLWSEIRGKAFSIPGLRYYLESNETPRTFMQAWDRERALGEAFAQEDVLALDLKLKVLAESS